MYSQLTPKQKRILDHIDDVFITSNLTRREFVTVLGILIQKHKTKQGGK